MPSMWLAGGESATENASVLVELCEDADRAIALVLEARDRGGDVARSAVHLAICV